MRYFSKLSPDTSRSSLLGKPFYTILLSFRARLRNRKILNPVDRERFLPYTLP